MDQPDATADALPTARPSRLRGRARILQTLRRWFEDHDYLEVETPLLSRDICVDAWLDPFEIDSGAFGRLFLQTSPEFHMKRLLASGSPRVFQLTRSFRAGEQGDRHNPEFTILEWYATGETYDRQMELVEELVRTVAEVSLDAGASRIRQSQSAGEWCEVAAEHRNADPLEHSISLPAAPFPRMRYDDAFAEFAGKPVLALGTRELRDLAAAHQVSTPDSLHSDDRDGWLNLLLATVVEPRLARFPAVFLHDYPASQAALARVRDASPPIAERFELYLNGIEICNGYQELTDADELDRRMNDQAGLRRQRRLGDLPVRSRLSDAMRSPGLPESAGVALGVDRLVMWRLGAERLDEVVAFPFGRA